MMYFELTQKGDVLGSNLGGCPFNASEFLPEVGKSRKLRLNGIEYVLYADEDEYEDIHSVVVVADDADLSKSLRLRKALLPAITDIFHRAAKHNVERAHDYAHSVNTLHGKMKQELEEYTDPEEFYGTTYADVHNRIKLKILSEPDSASDILIYLSKRIADMGAHLRGFEVVETQEVLNTESFTPTRLKAALLSSFSTIQGEMYEDMWIQLKVNIENDVRVTVDRELLNLVLYNIFDNTRKYILINSEIHANWDETEGELTISMMSLAVNQSEVSRIFQKGYRGDHARKSQVDGRGFGLFAVKRAMELMGGGVSFDYRSDKEQRYDGQVYRENYFHLKFADLPRHD